MARACPALELLRNCFQSKASLGQGCSWTAPGQYLVGVSIDTRGSEALQRLEQIDQHFQPLQLWVHRQCPGVSVFDGLLCKPLPTPRGQATVLRLFRWRSRVTGCGFFFTMYRTGKTMPMLWLGEAIGEAHFAHRQVALLF